MDTARRFSVDARIEVSTDLIEWPEGLEERWTISLKFGVADKIVGSEL